MIILTIPYVGFLLGYGGAAAMKHTIKYVRGYWVLHDGKGRLIALASQCPRLIRKLQQWKLQNTVTHTETL
jgi:hypothetical protein